MITPHGMRKFLAKLALLPFFPPKEDRQELGEFVVQFAQSDEQLDWLGNRMLTLYTEWPGPHELRAAFCSKFRPKDGVSTSSTVYLDGIPSERSMPAVLGLPSPAALVEAAKKDPPITDPEAKQAVEQLARDLPRMPRRLCLTGLFRESLAEVVTAPVDREPLPGPTPQIITQEDVDRAVAELHRGKTGV